MSKIYDSDFLDFVENFDIVCFLETFMIENALPNNIFKSFLPAFILPANASAGRGRNSGGIIMLVTTQFTNIVQRVETDFKNSIVLLFKNVLQIKTLSLFQRTSTLVAHLFTTILKLKTVYICSKIHSISCLTNTMILSF